MTNRKKLLKLRAISRDGGTKLYINPEEEVAFEEEVKKESSFNQKVQQLYEDLPKYYIDGRISSETKGELYDKYPSAPDAKILDKSLFELID